MVPKIYSALDDGVALLGAALNHIRGGEKMFNTMKFFQAIGVSILLTVVVTFIVSLIPFGSVGFLLLFQMILIYGSVGFFCARWNPATPYTAAYLGAVLLSFSSFLLYQFVFNIFIFADPDGIGRSMSLAVVFSLLFAYITVLIRKKREGVLT